MVEKFLRLPAVEAATGLRHAEIYERIVAGTFPRQIKIGSKAVAWRESEIEAWQAARIAERDTKKAA